MWSIDWNAVAAWITGVSTFGLLVVAVLAAFYAKRAADSALETLRLESEPVLMASIAHDGERIDLGVGMSQHEDGRLFLGLLPGESLPQIRSFLIAVENVGRSPALDVKVQVEAKPIESAIGEPVPAPVTMPLFIQGLPPNGRYVFGVHNGTGLVVEFNVLDARRASFSRTGGTESTRLFTSSALPITF